MNTKNFLDNFDRSQKTWMYACTRCGDCIDECPVYQQTSDPYTAPGYKIKKMRPLVTKRILPFLPTPSEADVKKLVKGLYDCTLCGRCASVCPFQYDLVELWETSRESALKRGLEPEPIRSMIKDTLADKNFMKRPLERRKSWTSGVEVPQNENVETLYFVGCATSYTPTLKVVAKGVSTILNAAKEDWALMNEEWCCGVPMKFGGDVEGFKEFVTHNVEMIESSGVKRVVFNCPGCYRMFKQEYPKVLGRKLKFSLIHITELVDEYVKTGKIVLKEKLSEKITYHDPCELSRLLGVIEQPRHVLTNLTTNFSELPENKLNTHCCGSGGLFKAVDTQNSIDIAKQRIKQAETIGSETLISACPSCVMNLSQAARFTKSKVKVIDFADAVARQIKEV